MPTFKLNDQEIPFEPGDTVIRAAWRQGVEIPHYCWHPGLSVAANCRMCLVEVTSGRAVAMPVLRWDDKKQDYVEDTKPKLQPACQMAASEGMEVSSESATVQEAQRSVQEFLLLNHPVDCPICDQAGECKLQDYWLDHQHDLKRKRTEPVHKPKGVRFGPTIVYDAERCIMCTRCIRVCDELVQDHVLDMRERGNKNEIVLAPGRELDHKYTLMTEHVCPVGALTSRDFRFKARVWFLKSTPSVCPGCATGCNMHADYDPRVQQVFRLRPRDNLRVNQFWMCDDGMMTYRRIHEDRVHEARVGRHEQSELVGVDESLRAAAEALDGTRPERTAFVLSAQHCTEDNFALAQLATARGSTKMYLAALGGWEGDQVLRDSDNNPNRAGAIIVSGGRHLPDLQELIEDVLAGEIEAVVALGGAAAESAAQLGALEKLSVVITLTANKGPLSEVASLVLPVASWAEMRGTFVNAKGLHQEFRRVVPPPIGVRPAWETIASLADALNAPLGFRTLEELRATLPNQTVRAESPSEVRV